MPRNEPQASSFMPLSSDALAEFAVRRCQGQRIGFPFGLTVQRQIRQRRRSATVRLSQMAENLANSRAFLDSMALDHDDNDPQSTPHFGQRSWTSDFLRS